MVRSDSRGPPPRIRGTWLTVRDVAAVLHVSEDTVRRWIRSERMEAKFFGGRAGYRVRRADLQKFLRHSAERPDTRRRKAGLTKGRSEWQRQDP